MALTKMESYIGAVQANVDIMPILWQNIKDTAGIEVSKPLKLRHVSIFDDSEGNEYIIDKFIFTIKEGVFASPLNDKGDLVGITSIIPKQSGYVEIFYLR